MGSLLYLGRAGAGELGRWVLWVPGGARGWGKVRRWLPTPSPQVRVPGGGGKGWGGTLVTTLVPRVTTLIPWWPPTL